MTSDDITLAREYAASQSERAFAALVERHLGLVHSVALRIVGEPHLAEEVAQAVFIILARKAGTLGTNTILPGWLYKTTRYVADNALRDRRRRERREQEIYMRSTVAESDASVGQELASLLEPAMAALGEHDRNAALRIPHSELRTGEVLNFHPVFDPRPFAANPAFPSANGAFHISLGQRPNGA